MSVGKDGDPSLSRLPLKVAGGLPIKTGSRFILHSTSPAVSVPSVRCLSSSLQLTDLAPHVREFVEEHAKILRPTKIHVCDGSEEENRAMVDLLEKIGRLKKLDKYENW